jgi:hypothetical protein
MVLNAAQYIRPEMRIVEGAQLLANAVNDALRENRSVAVDLSGMPSISLSYFHTLLLEVAGVWGNDAIKTRVSFRFRSQAQEQIFQRSLEAVLKLRGD